MAVHRSLFLSVVLAGGSLFAQSPKTDFKFDFGPGKAEPGYIQVKTDAIYNKESGFGFEPQRTPAQAVDNGGADPRSDGLITSDQPFSFSVAEPEGNYRVTVMLGDAKAESTTTVKAETRRLMLEQVHTDAGKFERRTFIVNVRSPLIAGTNEKIQLDPREFPGYWTWDDKLTLTFLGSHPAVCAVEISKVNDATTIYLCGDSTVTDQMSGAFGTWGMNLTRWFNDKVAIANYAESGETLKAFKHEKRWDKIISAAKPGDYVFIQFGHNDLNKTGTNAMWPATEFSGDWTNTYSEPHTDYKQLLKDYAAAAKAKGMIPVIVSPMTKVNTANNQGIPSNGLGDYPACAIEAAKEAGIAYIDLNSMSTQMHVALGPQDSRKAVNDGNHSNTYGGYLLSRCIVEGIKQNLPDLAKNLVADAGRFDPQMPSPLPDEFKIPTDPGQPGIPSFGGGRGRGPRGTTTNSTPPARGTN